MVTNETQKFSHFNEMAELRGSLNTKITNWAFVWARVKSLKQQGGHTDEVAFKHGSIVLSFDIYEGICFVLSFNIAWIHHRARASPKFYEVFTQASADQPVGHRLK